MKTKIDFIKSALLLTTALILSVSQLKMTYATEPKDGTPDPSALDEAAGLEGEWQNPDIVEQYPNLAEPLGPEEQSVGFYAKGKLHNPSQISSSTDFLVKLFANRNTQFGNQTMIEALSTSAQALLTLFPESERMQVGDISSLNGGQLLRHMSHQNGLDADVVYFRNNYREQNQDYISGFDENFVSNGYITVNFDIKRNYMLMKHIVANYQVNRIFVAKAIKRAICDFSKISEKYEDDKEMLRRLRPLKNHGDHFHLRLKCPPHNPRCKSQSEPPVGSGCG